MVMRATLSIARVPKRTSCGLSTSMGRSLSWFAGGVWEVVGSWTISRAGICLACMVRVWSAMPSPSVSSWTTALVRSRAARWYMVARGGAAGAGPEGGGGERGGGGEDQLQGPEGLEQPQAAGFTMADSSSPPGPALPAGGEPELAEDAWWATASWGAKVPMMTGPDGTSGGMTVPSGSGRDAREREGGGGEAGGDFKHEPAALHDVPGVDAEGREVGAGDGERAGGDLAGGTWQGRLVQPTSRKR